MHTGRQLMGSEKFKENFEYLDTEGLLVLDRILVAWDACDTAFTEVSEDARRTMKGFIAHRMLDEVRNRGDKKMIHRALLGVAEMLEGIKDVRENAYLH